MILMLNNRDSFVFNLARYLTNLGAVVETVDSDRITLEQIRQLAPEAIVISPGPSHPDDAGLSVEVVRRFGSRTPILGVCLGHQAIAVAHGVPVHRAASPLHGQAVRLSHSGKRLFEKLPEDMEAGLYNSLICAQPSPGSGLLVEAVSPSGEVMALTHHRHPVYGVQFHPESILTTQGEALLGNFLKMSREWQNQSSRSGSPAL